MKDDEILAGVMRRGIESQYFMSIDEDGGWVFDNFLILTDVERAAVLRCWLDVTNEPPLSPTQHAAGT